MCDDCVPVLPQVRAAGVDYRGMSVQMKKVPVVIETARHRIYGKVAVPAVSRLSDYANEPQRRFWAVTEAQIAPIDDPERARAVEFVLVGAHEISLISQDATGVSQVAERRQPADFAPLMDESLARGMFSSS